MTRLSATADLPSSAFTIAIGWLPITMGLHITSRRPWDFHAAESATCVGVSTQRLLRNLPFFLRRRASLRQKVGFLQRPAAVRFDLPRAWDPLLTALRRGASSFLSAASHSTPAAVEGDRLVEDDRLAETGAPSRYEGAHNCDATARCNGDKGQHAQLGEVGCHRRNGHKAVGGRPCKA